MAKGFKLSNLVTDQTAEQEGVWVDAGEGLRLKIARLGNPAYEETLHKRSGPFKMQARAGAADLALLKKNVIYAMARHVLKGWENLVDDNEQPIPFTIAKAEELLTNVPDFYKMVEMHAQNAEAYRKEAQQEAVGNS